ncbi:MAG: GTP-binding protein [Rubrobacteraceae bacterium]
MRFKGKLPVTLVGGFLGAGKTTLVNHLISSGGRRYGVVVNEFGDVGVDAAEVTGLRAMSPDWRPGGHRLQHGAGLDSFTLRSEKPLRLERWVSFHRRQILERPDRVLRAKGILHFEELDDPMVLQAVRELYSFDPYYGDHDGGSELVVIGRGLDEGEYRRAFARVPGEATILGSPDAVLRDAAERGSR